MKPRHMLPLLCALLMPAISGAQERGSLLVATDGVTEEGFAETVILLLHLGEDGAIGVAINRPTWVSAEQLLPDLERLHGYRGTVYHGGPLAQATVLVLRRGTAPDPESQPLVDDVYMSSDLDRLAAELERTEDDSRLRFYAGHVGWRPGELEQEIEAGAWRALPASAAAIFDDEPLSLWRRLAGATQLTVRVPAGARAAASDGEAASTE